MYGLDSRSIELSFNTSDRIALEVLSLIGRNSSLSYKETKAHFPTILERDLQNCHQAAPSYLRARCRRRYNGQKKDRD